MYQEKGLDLCGPLLEGDVGKSLFEIQILSDLHLEMGNQDQFTFEAIAPYLALLGDIGSPLKPTYKEFLLAQAKRFIMVFVVAGNHEFFKSTWATTREKIAQICSLHPNLVFLDRHSVVIDKVRVIGATLWSHCKPASMATCEARLNDYTLVKIEDPKSTAKQRLITAKDTNEWHDGDLKYIVEQVNLAKKKRRVCTCFNSS